MDADASGPQPDLLFLGLLLPYLCIQDYYYEEGGEEDEEGYLYMDEQGYYYDEEGNCYTFEDEEGTNYLLVAELPYDPVCPSVGLLVGLSVIVS